MWMIVGLGNPGSQYELTRHNVGFLVIDHLKNLLKVNFNNNFHGLCAKTTISDNVCLLIKPQTFMNKSGLSIQSASSFL
jgi:PTH1 family peptidyl-tRNA hydrolase